MVTVKEVDTVAAVVLLTAPYTLTVYVPALLFAAGVGADAVWPLSLQPERAIAPASITTNIDNDRRTRWRRKDGINNNTANKIPLPNPNRCRKLSGVAVAEV